METGYLQLKYHDPDTERTVGYCLQPPCGPFTLLAYEGVQCPEELSQPSEQRRRPSTYWLKVESPGNFKSLQLAIRVCKKEVGGASVSPWGITVHVYWWFSQVKANKYWDALQRGS